MITSWSRKYYSSIFRFKKKKKRIYPQLGGRKNRPLPEIPRLWSWELYCLMQSHLHVCSVTKACLTLVIPWPVAYQAPLSLGFPRQEYWRGLPFPSPRDLPDPGIKPSAPAMSPTLQADSLPLSHRGSPSLFVLEMVKFRKEMAQGHRNHGRIRSPGLLNPRLGSFHLTLSNRED